MLSNQQIDIRERFRYDLGRSTAFHADDFAIKKRTQQVLSHISLEGKAVLDMGCGNGQYTIKLAEFARKTVGIDCNPQSVVEACINNNKLGGRVMFVESLAESLPFCDHAFDVVLAIEMLEHVVSEDKTLKEANRVLKKHGYLVIYVPNKLYPFETHGLKMGHHTFSGFYESIPFFSWFPQSIRNKFERARIYTKKDIINLLHRHGFVVQEVDYMYPPLDKLGNKFAVSFLRRLLAILERNRLTKKFGISIFILAYQQKA